MNNKLRHLAIIMDGNRRWAKAQGFAKMKGHTEGAKNIKRIAEKCITEGISYLTIWGLSTENLRERGEKELEHIFRLAEKAVDHLEWLHKNNIRVRHIGNLLPLPDGVRRIFEKTIAETSANNGLNLTLAFNYGGRDEIVRAVRKILAEPGNSSREGNPENLNEEDFSKYLDTADLPDPDLIVRTGGAMRMSGFLPWQSVYSEFYFTDSFWPAFDEKELEKVVAHFDAEQRNFGK